MNTEEEQYIHAQILEASDDNINICADYIKKGGIVGMPTETVYGLAANALDVEAVKKIFEYKGRPLSDPLIVHVTSIDMAKKLIQVDDKTSKIFELLANKYWPGPLTIVLKANFEVISPIITANTDYIGVRFPNNEIAKKLIDFSGCPIAAPSANKFCHVSPVNPLHVYEDFKEFPVKILDGGVCNFCMESTVLKIIQDEKKLLILRMGAISPEELENFMKQNYPEYKIEVYKKKHTKPVEEEIEVDQEAPGQFIKHYSPQLDTYILDHDAQTYLDKDLAKECVVIDYQSIIYNEYRDNFQCYMDLSTSGDPEEVMKNLYDYLRNAEKVPNAKLIIFCDINKYMSDNPHKETLVDRFNKASAGRKININI